MQTAEENEVYHRVSTPARNSYDDYRYASRKHENNVLVLLSKPAKHNSNENSLFVLQSSPQLELNCGGNQTTRR